MGRGSYTAADWAKLKTSRKITEHTTSQIFAENKMNPKFDPRYIEIREARDSEEHPKSTPIMIGVDVTGSMGYLSTQIIKESLNALMMQLYASDYVKDPQILFAAIGDASYDEAPLQVTQFESDIRIAEQLLGLWLENGGGDEPEDYELLWYFADKHTDIDCYNKRNEKGFCFTIGDAGCQEGLTTYEIKKVFKESEAFKSSKELAAEASKRYEIFHIMIGDSARNFAEIIPGRVLLVSKSDINYLPEIIISTIQLAKGKQKEEVLAQWGKQARCVVDNAIQLLVIDTKRKISF